MFHLRTEELATGRETREPLVNNDSRLFFPVVPDDESKTPSPVGDRSSTSTLQASTREIFLGKRDEPFLAAAHGGRA
jgi:hypothetical protein